jgi:hypothetical protein
MVSKQKSLMGWLRHVLCCVMILDPDLQGELVLGIRKIP